MEPERAGEIVERALAYPYEAPGSSFIQLGSETLELPAAGPDLSGRTPLLAYGANAAPEALAAKLATLPEMPLPVLRTALAGFDAVYSAHVSFHGAIPATLAPSPGTTAPVFVAHPTAEQLALLSATEPNYELGEVEGTPAFLSRHGPLLLDGEPVALAAVASAGRTLAEMSERQVLELARRQLAPGQTLEQFVLACVESGGRAPLKPW
ncbi:MAG TPA: hypothetical protein VFX45_07860 [Solirubrobacterales bacterium]|nr:hypothetical protein [Solirubrobacterales bacterium]